MSTSALLILAAASAAPAPTAGGPAVRATIQGHHGPAYCLAFSPDGTVLASGGRDGAVQLWEVAAGKRVAALSGHAGPVWAVAFSPDGKTLASAGFDYARGGVSIKLWEVSTAREVASFDFTYQQTSGIHSVAFDRTGRVLASGGNEGAVKLWRWATGKPATVLLHDRHNAVYSLKFSPDGKLLAAARWDGSLVLWDMPAGGKGK